VRGPVRVNAEAAVLDAGGGRLIEFVDRSVG
jgi:hypothetical protein